MAVTFGLLISIEGGEGAGKTVQCKALVAHLEQRGVPVRFVREPGGTTVGERIRDLLLFTNELSLGVETEALLFCAARAQLTNEVIRPALSAGIHVVADRFLDSTIAYQGYGRGADIQALRAANEFAVGRTVPNLTFLLDIPVKVAAQRIQKRSEQRDRIEAFGSSFHDRVREGYLRLVKEDPVRWVVLDATRPEVELTRLITGRVDDELRSHSNTISNRR